MSYFFVAMTIALTVYGQLVLKWQVGLRPYLVQAPYTVANIIRLLANLWVISAFAAAFGASLCWMAAISRLPISKAYPFMALNFVLVLLFATTIFHESLDIYKVAGTLVIVIGVVLLSCSPA
ncbi:EamA family transporter [Rhodanobacter glycinis]|uniref:EamA-like transporter family protein n=1 Tax=Rhodanobacter glycinis TaxID=582702 RepID=A0A1I4D5E0_9GAMM|nr:EamA family transporter [Rhodanobacter glycinis]SFK88345.1 EamA-like transporter family protein [Rhodanobacter glycinis]